MMPFQKYLRLLGLKEFNGSALIKDNVAAETVKRLYLNTLMATVNEFWMTVECRNFRTLVGMMGLQYRSFDNGIAWVRLRNSNEQTFVRVEVQDADDIVRSACECLLAVHTAYVEGVLRDITFR